MSDDDFSWDELVGDDKTDRETDVAPPSESLLDQARTEEAKKDAETSGGAASGTRDRPATARPSKPARPHQQGVRFAIPSSDAGGALRKILIASPGPVGIILGILIANFFVGKQAAKLEEEIAAGEERLGAVRVEWKRSLEELSTCTRDLSGVMSVPPSPGLTPRDYLVDKTRTRKEEIEAELNLKQEAIFSRYETKKKPRGQSRKEWKELQEEFAAYRRQGEELKKATREYKEALAGTLAKPTTTTDPALKERHAKRAAFLVEAKKNLAAMSED